MVRDLIEKADLACWAEELDLFLSPWGLKVFNKDKGEIVISSQSSFGTNKR